MIRKDFQCCVYGISEHEYTCIYMTFLSFFLGSFLLFVYALLFVLLSLIFKMPVCILMRERKKGCRFGRVRQRGGSGRSWGEGRPNQ